MDELAYALHMDPIELRRVNDTPLDPDCACPACRQFSRAYLHHSVKSGEIIAAMLLTWHNLTFYQDLMARLRGAIAAGALADFTARFRTRYGAEK